MLDDEKLQNKEIIDELKNVVKKYSKERRSTIIYKNEIKEHIEDEKVDDSSIHIFATKDGYLKKITEISLKRANLQKIKEEDEILFEFMAKNSDILWIITNKNNLYQLKLNELQEVKASELGSYIPNMFDFENDENILQVINPTSDKKFIVSLFENGKVAKVDIDSYRTKAYRKKIQNVYSDKSKLVKLFVLESDRDIVLKTNMNSYVRFNTELLNAVSSRNSQGVIVAKLPKNTFIEDADLDIDEIYSDIAKKIPKTPKKLMIQLEMD